MGACSRVGVERGEGIFDGVTEVGLEAIRLGDVESVIRVWMEKKSPQSE